MYKLFFLGYMLFVGFQVSGQSYGWTELFHTGGVNWDKIEDMAVDDNFNILVAGSFMNSVTINETHISKGGSDGLFIKTDSTGKVQWSKTIGGKLNDYYSQVRFVKKNQFVFAGCIDHENDSLIQSFVVGLCNEKGQAIHQVSFESGKGIQIFDIIVDKQQNIYISGAFAGFIKQGKNIISSGNQQNSFCVKLNQKLELKWFKLLNVGAKNEIGKLLIEKDVLTIIGKYNQITFQGITEKQESIIYLQALSTKGDSLFTKEIAQGYSIQNMSVCTDNYGKINVFFDFSDHLQIGSKYIQAVGQSDCGLINMSFSGVVNWDVHISGEGINTVSDIIATKDGLMLCGTFSKDMYVAQKVLSAQPYFYNTFLININHIGVVSQLSSFQTKNEFYPRRLIALPNDKLLIAASFKQTILFENSTIESIGEEDIVIAKLSPCEEEIDQQIDTLEWQGKTMVLNGGLGYKVYNWNQGIAWSQNFSATDTGVYTLDLIENSGCALHRAFVIVDEIPNLLEEENIEEKYTDLLAEEDIIIYPIPATDIVNWTILNKNITGLEVELIDELGKTYQLDIYKNYDANTSKAIQLNTLPKGRYYIRYYQGSSIFSKTIILN